jgi:hypothetical protein
VLLGLAFLAARWSSLSQFWRRALLAGGTLDFMLGLLLHFGVQSQAFDRWWMPGRSVAENAYSHSIFAVMNFNGKSRMGAQFLADRMQVPFAAVVALQALLLVVAMVALDRLARGRSASPDAICV